MQPNVAVPFDYSRPVVVNTFVTSSDPAEGSDSSADRTTPEQEAALARFDEGLARFRAGDYAGALALFDEALRGFPGDPVIHEVRALALFAVGDFQSAAAALNSLLAVSPGMDWTTMSGLYGSVDEYTTQLRALEAHVRENPNDAAARFVLAYHYLVMGHQQQAIDTLRVVVELQPRDVVARKILDSLVPPEPSATEQPATPPADQPADQPVVDAPVTDLVGTWQATAADTTIRLAVDEDFGFTWTATPAGGEPVEVRGEIDIDDDMLVLDSAEQGAMAGEVESAGPDAFRFTLAGTSPRQDDSTLTFERVQQ